jgi:cation diffusion facilitator CzcD-associated flavoprotein CzcO
MKPKIAVIGTGPSGITALKNLLDQGLDAVAFDRNEAVGGNWIYSEKESHSSVFETTHIISSKTLSQYEDFTFDDFDPSTPDYPSHDTLRRYFQAYAEKFNLLPHIQFGTLVTSCQRNPDGSWEVTTEKEGQTKTETYTHLVVANGHHWKPRMPNYQGNFTGELLHSHNFKKAAPFAGKRVLVIGGGNSACDVAVEASRIAGSVDMSMRSPQWFVPKYLFGVPSDVLATRSLWMPARLKQWSLTLLLRLVQGSYRKIGLPENTKPVLSHHPTVNSDLLDIIRHGRIVPKPSIDSWEGKTVTFTDGSQAEYDIIVAATGFTITFPFFDRGFINFESAEKVPLYRKMMHADIPNLYFIGLFQPLGCIWPLADYQAKIACREILGQYTRPNDIKTRIEHEIANPHYNFEGGTRHSTEVDYHKFRAELLSELKHVSGKW